MVRIDVNCLLGHWPYRKIRKCTFEDLKQVHRLNKFSFGCVSSINSIFYNDPFEGDLELHEIIKNSDYKHILTINPLLPGYKHDIERGISLFGIRGVRVYPGYHGYKLNDSCFDELCSLLRLLKLPLFLTVRMDDERITYLTKPEIPRSDELRAFAEAHPDLAVILLNIRDNEFLPFKDLLNSRNNLFVDTTGFRGELFIVERLLNEIKAESIIYGSLHPLYALKGSLLPVERANIDETLKESILGSNLELFLGDVI